MRPSITRIGHVGLAVSDIDSAVRFYTEMLGMTLTESFTYPEEEVGHGVAVAAGAFLRLDSTHHCLSIFSYRRDIQPERQPHQYGLHHLAFELPTPGALLELYQWFRERGVPIVNSRKGGPGNQPRFYARDPEGNLLEFYWGIDHIGWNGKPRAYEAIQEIDLEAFDFERYLEERDRAAAEFAGRDEVTDGEDDVGIRAGAIGALP